MLSKTDFLLYLDSQMHFWAKVHDALVFKAPTSHDQLLMEEGQAVEALARQYLEEFVLPQNDHVRISWQQTFTDGEFEIRTDALILDEDADAYDLYEIKSGKHVKKEHEIDITYQVLVLEANLPLRHKYILHIDPSYTHGESLDLARFFTVEEVSDKIDQYRDIVRQERQVALTVSQQATPNPAWACTDPKTCPCPDLCHPYLPARPIYDLPRIGKKAKDLREMGITAVADIPEGYRLSANQAKHARAMRTGEAIIDREAIQTELAKLDFPLYFLDYETCNPAVPRFQGYTPYEHIIFQYSLHKLSHPEAELEHSECLILDKEEPAPRLVSQLLTDLGPTGSVIVWHKSAESNWNVSLAQHCPEHAERLLGINERLVDLKEIFSKGYFVHPDFHGSVSIKAVLPVLCPELSYDNLAISNGEEAMQTWYKLQQEEVSPEQLEQIRANLLTYCELDTYGMVAIWEYLRQL